MASPLDHLEKTLADNYRKELDQEENVWRSLPFFAATLALQFALLVPLEPRLARLGGAAAWAAAGLAAAVLVATLTALVFLFASIASARFRYVAPEAEVLAYALALDDPGSEDAAMARAEGFEDPSAAFKRFLARQYAEATALNRAANERRARRRTVAGVATLASVVATLGLVFLVVVHQIGRA